MVLMSLSWANRFLVPCGRLVTSLCSMTLIRGVISIPASYYHLLTIRSILYGHYRCVIRMTQTYQNPFQ